MVYRLTRNAENQIAGIIIESDRGFGPEAARRYMKLILTALDRVGDDPILLGSVPVRNASGVRQYALRLSRQQLASIDRVARPRHSLVYRITNDGHAVILGLVHDHMLLSRAVDRLSRAAGSDVV